MFMITFAYTGFFDSTIFYESLELQHPASPVGFVFFVYLPS